MQKEMARTSLYIEAELLREAKVQAAKREITLKELFSIALRKELAVLKMAGVKAN